MTRDEGQVPLVWGREASIELDGVLVFASSLRKRADYQSRTLDKSEPLRPYLLVPELGQSVGATAFRNPLASCVLGSHMLLPDLGICREHEVVQRVDLVSDKAEISDLRVREDSRDTTYVLVHNLCTILCSKQRPVPESVTAESLLAECEDLFQVEGLSGRRHVAQRKVGGAEYTVRELIDEARYDPSTPAWMVSAG